MKKQFTEEQIIGFLREAEVGGPVKELELKRVRAHSVLAPSEALSGEAVFSSDKPNHHMVFFAY